MTVKIKRSNDHVIIMSSEGHAAMSLAPDSLYKSVDTLLEFVERLTHENKSLNMMRSEDAESYSVAETKALLRDTTTHLTPATRNSVEASLAFSPSYLQAESLRNQVKAMANVYRDCADSVIASNGDTLSVGKALLAKANAITRDLELLEGKLSEPLQKLKSIKMEKSMRKEILQKGIAQGKMISNAQFSGMTTDTLETARALNMAKQTLGSKKDAKAKIVKEALKISKS
jgi:hypothetical protein